MKLKINKIFIFFISHFPSFFSLFSHQFFPLASCFVKKFLLHIIFILFFWGKQKNKIKLFHQENYLFFINFLKGFPSSLSIFYMFGLNGCLFDILADKYPLLSKDEMLEGDLWRENPSIFDLWSKLWFYRKNNLEVSILSSYSV